LVGQVAEVVGVGGSKFLYGPQTRISPQTRHIQTTRWPLPKTVQRLSNQSWCAPSTSCQNRIQQPPA